MSHNFNSGGVKQSLLELNHCFGGTVSTVSLLQHTVSTYNFLKMFGVALASYVVTALSNERNFAAVTLELWLG
jgi:hypothetical protein